jgi:hypothetical protein
VAVTITLAVLTASAISATLHPSCCAPRTAGALGFGALLFAVSLPTGSAVVFAVGLAALLVGMAPIGWTLLSETDEQWEHPPRLSTSPAT